MAIVSDTDINSNPRILYLKQGKNRKEVRWYLMTYPQSSKGLTEGLKREVERRKRSGEKEIEYFAPTFVEAVEKGGKLVNSEKLLLFNYFFVHASEEEIYRMKTFEPQYSFFRKCVGADGVSAYPFVSEEVIRSLRCIAAAYCGKVPVYLDNAAWLIKGDRVKIVRGQFKGVEATLFENQRSGEKEIMVNLDKFAWAPVLKLRSGDYQLLELYNKSADACELLNDKQLCDLHNALLRYYKSIGLSSDYSSRSVRIQNPRVSRTSQSDSHLESKTIVNNEKSDYANLSSHIVESDSWQSKDQLLASEIIRQFEGISPSSDTKRSKMFAALLLAYKIKGDEEKLNALATTVKQMLPAVKAEHPRALLLLSLYATTANEVYRSKFEELANNWTRTANLKKNKQVLLEKFNELVSVL